MNRVLIGSSVRQKPTILQEFLKGLIEINKQNLEIDYFLVDDNDDLKSSKMLLEFKTKYGAIVIKGSELYNLRNADNNYICNNVTHFWKAETIIKISFYKDYIIKFALDNDYDYLFLVDSDIVLDKRCLVHLINCNKDIIAEVFWSQWYPNNFLEPQTFYMEFSSGFGPRKDIEYTDLDAQFRIPGIYQVEGTGACTLISKNALLKGVKFKKIDNIRSYGEDRDFCIRANVLDIKIYMDTTYPCYHIYRESYISRIDEFKRDGFKYDMCQTYTFDNNQRFKLHVRFLRFLKHFLVWTAHFTSNIYNNKYIEQKYYKVRDTTKNSMLFVLFVDNNSMDSLRSVINSSFNYCSYIVIVINNLNRCLIDELKMQIKDSPKRIYLIQNNQSSTRVFCRKINKLLYTVNPGWMLFLSQYDVLISSEFDKIRLLIENENVDIYCFRRFYMLDENQFRTDSYWNPYVKFYPYLVRYVKGFDYKFDTSTNRLFPCNISFVKKKNVEVNLNNYEFARK